MPDGHFLGGTAAESRDQLRLQVLSGIIVTVIEGRILRHTKGLAARDYCDLRDGIDVLLQKPGQRVATFMIGDDVSVLFGKPQGTLRAKEDLIQCLAETRLRYRIQVAARSEESSFVDEVGKVRANHTRSGAGNGNQVHIAGQRHVARVNLQDGQAAIPVGTLNRPPAVEAPRSQQCLVQAIWAVGSADYYNRLALIATIPLHQQLVHSLPALIIPVNSRPASAVPGLI